MLRIECDCGKFLKVDEELAGKRVKCPACGESLLVKRAAATAASARPSARRAADDLDDDDDDRPRKKGKQVAKKGGSGLLLIALLGGALLIFFVLILAGVGAWFFFLRKTDDTAAGGQEKAPPTDPIAIRLLHPRKVGDVREVTMVLDNTSLQTTNPNDGLPPITDNKKAKGTLECKIKTLLVDAKGRETKWQLTVTNYKIDPLPAFGTSARPGDVFILSLVRGQRGRIVAIESGPVVDGESDKFMAVASGRDQFDFMVEDDDELFGTSEKQAVGAIWAVNKSAILRSADNGGFLADESIDFISGSSKLAAVSNEAGPKCAKVEVATEVKVNQPNPTPLGPAVVSKVAGTMSTKLTYLVPVENPKGYVRRVLRSNAKLHMDVSNAARVATVDINNVCDITMDVKYLANEGEPQPKDTGKDTSKDTSKDTKPTTDTPKDTPKPPDLPKIAVGDTKASWFAGANLNITIDYANSGGPFKRDSKFVAYVYVPDAKGVKKPFVVETRAGDFMFNPKGKFSGIVQLPDGFAGAATNKLDVAIFEAPGGTTEVSKYVSMATSEGIPITGTPPVTTPETKPARIDLTNAKVERSGTKYTISADYKFGEGSADANTTYTWQLEVTVGGNKNTVQLDRKFGSEYAMQGKLFIQKDNLNIPDNTPFLMTIQRKLGDKTDQIAFGGNGLVTAAKDTMPKGSPEITKHAVVRQNNKFNVQVSYKLGGQPDPNAGYAIVIEFKGGKLKNSGFVPVAQFQAGQAKAEDNVSVQLPAAGYTDYEVMLVEVTQKNPQGKHLAKASGKVQ
jgi:hypothetical protein